MRITAAKKILFPALGISAARHPLLSSVTARYLLSNRLFAVFRGQCVTSVIKRIVLEFAELSASDRPISAGRDWPLYGSEYSRDFEWLCTALSDSLKPQVMSIHS